MKTETEAILDVLTREERYDEMITQYEGNTLALEEADWLFQQGISAEGIDLALQALGYERTTIN